MDREKVLKDYEGALNKEAITKTNLMEAKIVLDGMWADLYELFSSIKEGDKKLSEKRIENNIIRDSRYRIIEVDYRKAYLEAHLASAKVKHLEAVLMLETKYSYKLILDKED